MTFQANLVIFSRFLTASQAYPEFSHHQLLGFFDAHGIRSGVLVLPRRNRVRRRRDGDGMAGAATSSLSKQAVNV